MTFSLPALGSRPRPRLVRQVDATDCGPACLAMVLGYWGRREPLYRLRDLAATTQSGTTLLGLMRAAQQLHMSAQAYAADLEGLRQVSLPAILHWEHNHYVVLYELRPNAALIADPGAGLRRVPLGEVGEKWTGKVLSLMPETAFVRGTFQGKRGVTGLLAHLQHFQGAGATLFEILFGTLILSLLSLASPIMSQVLFDRVLTFREAHLLPSLLAGILILAAFQTLFTLVRSYLSGHLTSSLSYRLKLGYIHHLLRLPLRIHETRLVGDLLQRFGDLSNVQQTLTSLMITVPVSLLSLAVSLILISSYSFSLAGVAALGLLLDILYVSFISPRLRENSRKVLKKEGELSSFMIGSLEGISALKAFRAESWALLKGRNQVSGVMDQSWAGFRLTTNSGAVFGLLGALSSMLTLWYGATQVMEMKLTVGQLVASYGLVNNAMSALSTLIGMVQTVQQGAVSSDRLAEVLELPTEEAGDKRTELPALQEALQVSGLNFHYLEGRPILSNVHLELRKGSFTVLLGNNGAGKSTLCNVLSGLLASQAGQLHWDHLDLAEYSAEAVRGRVAYLRQEVPLFYTSLLDNLTLGRSVPLETVQGVLNELRMDSVVRRLPEGLNTVLGGDSPYRLSSGEKQLVGLVRLLLSEAELLILDEPTATLDMQRELNVLGVLSRLKGLKTLLVITHRPALLELADDILELEGGEVRPSRYQLQDHRLVVREPALEALV